MVGPKVFGHQKFMLGDLYALPLDDPEIMRGFREDDLVGVFQFEGGTTRGICKRVQPETLLDLSDINALSRPGPLFSGAVDRYIDAKFGVIEVPLVHPLFDQHVESTYGQLVYQEQIMKVLADLAGFDTTKVLRVRKIIGKKLGEHQFAELWEGFADGCEATAGVDRDTAWRVWSQITTAAGYAFNIAHSYSYSVIAYWCMYMKKKYPEAFYAASLAKNGDGKDDIPRRTALLKDTKLFGRDIQVGRIDPMASREDWSVQRRNGGFWLIPGFIQIPGVGPTTAKAMYESQSLLLNAKEKLSNGVSLSDTESADDYEISWEAIGGLTKGVGPKTIDSIKKFASIQDPFGVHRTERQLDLFRGQLAAGDFEGTIDLSVDDFYKSTELASAEPWELVAWVGLVANVVYRDAVEYERTKTGKPIEQILEEMPDSHLVKHAVVFAYDEDEEVVIRISRKIYPKWGNLVSQLKEDYHIVAVLGKKMPSMGNSILPEKIWVLDPD